MESKAPSMAQTLTGLLESCASITETALSAKTLGTIHTEKSLDELIDNEIAIREWIQAETLVLSHYDQTGSAEETSKPRSLQQVLIDATLRQQQEALLLKRLSMATACRDSDKYLQVLINEGLNAVFDKEQAILEKRRDLYALRYQIHEAEAEGQRLQAENQFQWRLLHSGRNESECKQNNDASETQLLKRALQDIIVASSLDIHNSRRLQATLIQCSR